MTPTSSTGTPETIEFNLQYMDFIAANANVR